MRPATLGATCDTEKLLPSAYFTAAKMFSAGYYCNFFFLLWDDSLRLEHHMFFFSQLNKWLLIKRVDDVTAREGTVFVCSFIASILSFHLCLFNAFLVILTLAVLTSHLPHLNTEVNLMGEAERLRNSNKCITCCHTSEP